MTEILAWQLALNALALLLSVTAWAVAWHTKRVAAARQDMAGVETRLDDLDRRLAGATGIDQTHALALSVSTVEGNLRTIGARLEGLKGAVEHLDATVTRIEEFLLARGHE